MRLTPGARLALFLVIASGLYYAWNYLVPAGTRAQVAERVRAARGGGERTPPATAPAAPGDGGSASAPPAGGRPAPATPSAGEAILFITTAAKRDWVQQEVARFNAEHR